MSSSPFPDPVPVPVTGELDLHTYQPRDLGILLPEYFRECRLRGILSVRVIHGKGTGALQSGVRALLGRLPEVSGYRKAGESEGSWGATIVSLHPAEPSSGSSPVQS